MLAGGWRTRRVRDVGRSEPAEVADVDRRRSRGYLPRRVPDSGIRDAQGHRGGTRELRGGGARREREQARLRRGAALRRRPRSRVERKRENGREREPRRSRADPRLRQRSLRSILRRPRRRAVRGGAGVDGRGARDEGDVRARPGGGPRLRLTRRRRVGSRSRAARCLLRRAAGRVRQRDAEPARPGEAPVRGGRPG